MNDEINQATEGELQAPEENISEENTLQDSQPTEQIPEEITEEASEEVETGGETKKGAQSRIKELVRERNEEREKRISLEQKMAELTSQGDSGDYSPYTPQYQPGSEVTPEQLQQDIMRQADSIVQLRLRQQEAANRIRNESNDAVKAHAQLDPDSDQFDPELSETVTEAVEAYVRQNPYSASVKKFVDKLMKPYTKGVAKEVGKATENIAKQVSETALRPTNVRKQEKSAEEKSIAELEAELGIVQA